MNDQPRFQVGLERTATGHYVATNRDGVQVQVGSDAGSFSPVELLLAAIGACSAIDVDVVTSRRAEPERFEVEVSADKLVDETGGSRLRDVALDFQVAFGDDARGREAAGLVERLVKLSHERDCTVSRTVKHATGVLMQVDGRPVAGDPEN